ncbi:uncharacterized protein LOC131237105 isoform X2 [Magnolia sinica]|uniref:uncharacterized protein LOC131237105 isoform X2 n=1 Tax=Magnolia sinica TaxID=86752 RepID=UPI00265AB481|nr:uncharacterized protein LOC131237105 isoform X2 [Magnolia sinica]
MAGNSEEDSHLARVDSLSLPRDALKDLLSLGVCGRCIFRLFGVHSHAYSSSFLSTSILPSVLEEPKIHHESTVGNGSVSNGSLHAPHSLQESESEPVCSICLGILQFSHAHDQGNCVPCETRAPINAFAASIAELVKKEGHQIDSFSLEVSIPPVILEKEGTIRLYMKNKYGSEDWFQEKLLTENISVKDALKLSITNLLETLLAVDSGVSSFRVRLTYAHTKASIKLQNLQAKDHGCKRRKTGTEDCVDTVKDSLVQAGTECNVYLNGDSDAVIQKTLDGLQDHACRRLASPPEKAYKACGMTFHCYRTPIYIGGRYLKYSRNVSQTRWVIDDERMGEASVEEIIGSSILLICRGDNYKFHAAGREDIDVRMLGSGRPFLVEVVNARCVPSAAEIEVIEDQINNSRERFVRVRNLKVVGNQAWDLMREGEAEKQKQYAALVWISRPLEDKDLQTITSLKDTNILQKTPIRVLHRRSPLERKRTIHWMRVERIAGSDQYFLLHLCTQAGTYIKEFVHGDLGRTDPSIGSILGCRAEILQLDVTDVKMDCFN